MRILLSAFFLIGLNTSFAKTWSCKNIDGYNSKVTFSSKDDISDHVDSATYSQYADLIQFKSCKPQPIYFSGFIRENTFVEKNGDDFIFPLMFCSSTKSNKIQLQQYIGSSTKDLYAVITNEKGERILHYCGGEKRTRN